VHGISPRALKTGLTLPALRAKQVASYPEGPHGLNTSGCRRAPEVGAGLRPPVAERACSQVHARVSGFLQHFRSFANSAPIPPQKSHAAQCRQCKQYRQCRNSPSDLEAVRGRVREWGMGTVAGRGAVPFSHALSCPGARGGPTRHCKHCTVTPQLTTGTPEGCTLTLKPSTVT